MCIAHPGTVRRGPGAEAAVPTYRLPGWPIDTPHGALRFFQLVGVGDTVWDTARAFA